MLKQQSVVLCDYFVVRLSWLPGNFMVSTRVYDCSHTVYLDKNESGINLNI